MVSQSHFCLLVVILIRWRPGSFGQHPSWADLVPVHWRGWCPFADAPECRARCDRIYQMQRCGKIKMQVFSFNFSLFVFRCNVVFSLLKQSLEKVFPQSKTNTANYTARRHTLGPVMVIEAPILAEPRSVSSLRQICSQNQLEGLLSRSTLETLLMYL